MRKGYKNVLEDELGALKRPGNSKSKAKQLRLKYISAKHDFYYDTSEIFEPKTKWSEDTSVFFC